MKSRALSMRNALCAVALLALTALAASCSNKIQVDPLCPQTGFIGGTDQMTLLAPGTHEVVGHATINGFSGECKFKDKKSSNLVVSLTLPFTFERGKAGVALKNEQLPYFIAVLGPEEKILQRTAFTTTVSFDDDGIGRSSEDHVLKIPLATRAEAGHYKVIIGFAMTREQMKYNEDHKTDSTKPGETPKK
jgi:hypothetical protein